MARIVYGALVESIRGSIGGTCFQRNAYGYTVKKKPNIVKPNRPKQNDVKRFFAQAVRAWGDMTQTGRDNWDTWAIQNPQYSKFNPNSQLSGFACFVKWHFYQFQAGGSVVTSPHSPIPEVDNETFDLVSAASVLTLGIASSVGGEYWNINVYMTPHLKASQNFFTNRLRFVVQLTSDTYDTNITAAYTSVFGSIPTATDLIGLQYIMYQESGGAVISPQQVILTVAAS